MNTSPATLPPAPARAPRLSAADWAQVALQYGYFDQSHLIHDFQDFARASPQAWLARRR